MVNRKLLFSVFLKLGGFCGRNLGQISVQRCATSFRGELETSFVFILTVRRTDRLPMNRLSRFASSPYMSNFEQNQGAFV